MRQGEKALFGAAVEPLQQPAFRRQHGKGKQRLHKERVTVVKELPRIGAPGMGRQRERHGRAEAPLPGRARHEPVPEGCGAQHDILLGKERVNGKSIPPEERAQRHDGNKRKRGAHQLGRDGFAEGVVGGAQNAPPPGQKGPEGGQRRKPARHIGHEQIADGRHQHERRRGKTDAEYQQAHTHVKGNESALSLPP